MERVHGETKHEVLGSGDASQPFQAFHLRQAPLTYVSASTPTGGSTTLTVSVDGVDWTEVPSLYGAGPRNRVYVVRVGADGVVTVEFGDGVTGARLPTGVENVKATYRIGTGSDGMVGADRITQLLTRPMGVPDAGKAQFSNEPSTNLLPPSVSHGAVFSEFKMNRRFGSGTFATTVRLYAGVPRIDFETKILNNEKFVRYRVLFPTVIQNGRSVHEIPFGAIERPAAQEFPAQNWIDYGDGHAGVALLNRGLPGNNVADGTLMLSLLRSTRIQSYGVGGGFEGQASDTGLELGQERTFHYALVAHGGDWREAGVSRNGLEFNNPLIVHKAAPHPGELPNRWGLLEISRPNVVVSALKPGKSGTTILRVYEADGRATSDVAIKLDAHILSAREANLMEDPGAKLGVANDTLRFSLHPFQIKTFALKLRRGSR